MAARPVSSSIALLALMWPAAFSATPAATVLPACSQELSASALGVDPAAMLPRYSVIMTLEFRSLPAIIKKLSTITHITAGRIERSPWEHLAGLPSEVLLSRPPTCESVSGNGERQLGDSPQQAALQL